MKRSLFLRATFDSEDFTTDRDLSVALHDYLMRFEGVTSAMCEMRPLER